MARYLRAAFAMACLVGVLVNTGCGGKPAEKPDPAKEEQMRKAKDNMMKNMEKMGKEKMEGEKKPDDEKKGDGEKKN